jgi:hypothetical protein
MPELEAPATWGSYLEYALFESLTIPWSGLF